MYSSAIRICWGPLENQKKNKKQNTYKDPKNSKSWSKSWSESSNPISLHQKYRDTMQFHLTLWMELDISSKFLLFLSFHTIHQMQCGIKFHQVFCLLLPPLLIQQLSKSVVCSGKVHFTSKKLRNMDHICVVGFPCLPI